MAAGLRYSWRVSQILKSRAGSARQLSTTNSLAAAWNYEWKPGPYPKTQAEREAAAKKYGLLPEDYEPIPDDGCGYGDYPKLPDRGDEARDPYTNYDDPTSRRNFMDPPHIRHLTMTADRGDPGMYARMTANQQFLMFLCVVTGLVTAWVVSSMSYNTFTSNPWKPTQYPFDESKKFGRSGTGERVVHYSFEKP